MLKYICDICGKDAEKEYTILWAEENVKLVIRPMDVKNKTNEVHVCLDCVKNGVKDK